MRQPVIDPEKVNAWTESMRSSFAGTDLGTWLIVGMTVGALLLVIVTAWLSRREGKPAIMQDLDNLIKVKPAADHPAQGSGHAPVRH